MVPHYTGPSPRMEPHCKGPCPRPPPPRMECHCTGTPSLGSVWSLIVQYPNPTCGASLYSPLPHPHPPPPRQLGSRKVMPREAGGTTVYKIKYQTEILVNWRWKCVWHLSFSSESLCVMWSCRFLCQTNSPFVFYLATSFSERIKCKSGKCDKFKYKW